MSELYAENRFEPLSIAAATPGWRAQYVDPDSDKGYRTHPLIGWAVYRVSVMGRQSGDQELPQGNVIEGVVAPDGAAPICALELSDFMGYLAPDQDPETVEPKGGRKGRPEDGPKPPRYKPTPAGETRR
jgi:hypothetical protein